MIFALIHFFKDRKQNKLNKAEEKLTNDNKTKNKSKIKSKENKPIKKQKRKSKQKKKEEKLRKKSEYHKLSDFFLSCIFSIILIVIVFNLLVFFYGKEYKIDGRFYQTSEESYKFIPNMSICNITEYKEFLNLNINDNIYIYYDNNKWNYSKKKPFFEFEIIKGTIYDKNDYYIYIDFDLNDVITKKIFLNKNFCLDKDFSVVFKKYFGKYKIYISSKDFE